MNRRFPLEGLLRARDLQEEQAAAVLARANRERNRAEQAVRSARRQHAGLGFRDEDEKSRDRSGPVTWQAIVVARASSSARFRDLALAVDMARTSAEEATSAWTDARRKADAIGKLGERHSALVLADELRDEQRGLDEAALRQVKETP